MGTLHADGTYAVTAEEVESFHREGFVHLPGLLSEAEVAGIEVDYDRFLRREIAVPGKDYCDMAGDYGRDPADYSIINVMLPRRYYPAWQGNVLERRALAVAAQLQGAGMEIDYDQLLAKQPYKDDAVFAWHQDMAYWPDTPDTRTATVWCAIDDSTVENGCMRFVPGSHEKKVVPHVDSFAQDNLLTRGQDIAVDVDEASAVNVVLRAGQASFHHGHIFHASGPNGTNVRRVGTAIRFVAPSMKQVSGDRLLVSHVSGKDDYGHFEVMPPPAGRLQEEDFDRARRNTEMKKGILYKDVRPELVKETRRA